MHMLQQPPNLAEEISALAKTADNPDDVQVSMVTDKNIIDIKKTVDIVLPKKKKKHRHKLVQEYIISVNF